MTTARLLFPKKFQELDALRQDIQDVTEYGNSRLKFGTIARSFGMPEAPQFRPPNEAFASGEKGSALFLQYAATFESDFDKYLLNLSLINRLQVNRKPTGTCSIHGAYVGYCGKCRKV